ncbi:MAG TPA: hypothetical protein VF141_22440 [Chryseolinea sp.]
MDPHQLKQHLTDLVMDGREELALEELLAVSNSASKDIKKNVAALSNIYRKFEKDKLNGHLNPEKINFTSDRISQALLVIIEQITEDDESNRKAIDLDTLFHDISDLSGDGNTSIKRKGLVKTMSIIVPIPILMVLGILALNGTFTWTTNPGDTALKGWLGEWNHQMESNGNKEIRGSLMFELVDDGLLVGKAHNLFPDGSETINMLSQIEFSHNGSVIEGVWKTDKVQSLHGTFRLNLDDENRFDGYYTVVNQEGEFYWKGTK